MGSHKTPLKPWFQAAMTTRPPVAPILRFLRPPVRSLFYVAAFGAVQKALMPSLDGLRIMHCELSINGGTVMLSGRLPEFGKVRSRCRVSRLPCRSRSNSQRDGGRRSLPAGDEVRRLGRDVADQFVLGHALCGRARSLRSSLDDERTAVGQIAPRRRPQTKRGGKFRRVLCFVKPLYFRLIRSRPQPSSGDPASRRCGQICRGGRAGNRAWRDGPCRDARA